MILPTTKLDGFSVIIEHGLQSANVSSPANA